MILQGKATTEQEQELLKGYRKLRPEDKRYIMETIISAVADEAGSPSESLVTRQNGLPVEGNQGQGEISRKNRAFG